MEIRATSFSYTRNFTKVLLFSRNPGTLRRLKLNANHLISRWKKRKGGIRRIYLCIVAAEAPRTRHVFLTAGRVTSSTWERLLVKTVKLKDAERCQRGLENAVK